MRLKPAQYVDIPTPTGPMRTHLFEPLNDRPYPGVILYSEIYQMTGPIARTASMIAGQGYLVAVPEVYHEYATPGEAFAYDKAGTDRGNELKTTKTIASFDGDTVATIEFLKGYSRCSKQIASIGICLGGHLAFRASLQPSVAMGICFYATDIHQGSLGKGKSDDTLSRIAEIQGEMVMIWGRQDPHIPREGRRKIYDALTDANVSFSWHEFNGEHAFMRDEGHRYDPEHAHQLYGLVFANLARALR